MTSSTTNQAPRAVLKNLRRMMPRRDLSLVEGRVVAEKQALRFLHLTSCDSPADIIAAIAGLPRLQLDASAELTSSGLSAWNGSAWQILTNATDAATRQRFTVGHELKHILDHRFHRHQHAYLPSGGRSTPEVTEAVCDHFAGCLLMPRPWLKSAITSGLQDSSGLAAHFGVSRQAMRLRLDQTGLADSLRTQTPEQLFMRGRSTPQPNVWYPRTLYRRQPATQPTAA